MCINQFKNKIEKVISTVMFWNERNAVKLVRVDAIEFDLSVL